MREIKERQEIAKALNLGKYPVIRINMDESLRGWENLYEGDKVRVDFGKFSDGERKLIRGYVLYNKKENRISVSAETLMLVKELRYEDVMKSVEYGTSVILDDKQDVVIVMYSNKNREYKVYLGKTSKGRWDCATLMDIE